MPELPEVETIRKGIKSAIEGCKVKSAVKHRPNLRYEIPEIELLHGKIVTKVSRYGKSLFLHFADDIQASANNPSLHQTLHQKSNNQEIILLIHLGMSGRLTVANYNKKNNHNASETIADFYYDTKPSEKHDHVVFIFENSQNNKIKIIYNDPRRFGYMKLLHSRNEYDSYIQNSVKGLDPTLEELTPNFLLDKIKSSNIPIKNWLLDQTKITGLGNIYVSEVLFLSKINPCLPASFIDNIEKAQAIVNSINFVLEKAIKLGGSSLKDYQNANGEKGGYQDHFMVYDRFNEPCINHPTCNGVVEKITQSGRATYFCPQCQPEKKCQPQKKSQSEKSQSEKSNTSSKAIKKSQQNNLKSKPKAA